VSEASFSFQELKEAGRKNLAPVETLEASDGLTLSYRRYVPKSPQAVLLFYHGGGAHSGVGYQHLGVGLQAQFDVMSYMPDIRGHGFSAGRRGDTPTPKQVWLDVTAFIQHIRAQFPHLPLFLGGHSSGAALILNYLGQTKHEQVNGYVFLSPEFGAREKTARPSHFKPFASVNVPAFVLNIISGGLFCGHYPAVRLNYPDAALKGEPELVTSYTVNMAKALNPFALHKQFAAIDRPFGLWVGADDELILPDQILAIGNLAKSVRNISQVKSIPNTNHLSILIKAHETIGPWIAGMIRGTTI
jgi:alpha-beta hydrolase superfamily lysophospholipase